MSFVKIVLSSQARIIRQHEEEGALNCDTNIYIYVNKHSI